jgi:hypothetical protein
MTCPYGVFGNHTRQSRSCGLKQLKRALRVSGVVAVGGGDVGMPGQAQQADGQAAQFTPGRGWKPAWSARSWANEDERC